MPPASAVSFVNPGERDVNLPLALGTNTFSVAGDSVTSGTPFGLGLFFNDETNPGIAVYNANGGTGAFSVQAQETSTMGEATGGAATVPGPGVTSWAAGDGYSVTLTSYRMTSSSTPFVDLVGSGGAVGTPNGTADTHGAFTLEVTQPGDIQVFSSMGSAPAAGFDALAPGRTTITFDESPFPDGSANGALGAGARGVEITTQYSPLGVTFGTAAGGRQNWVFGQFSAAFTGKSLGNNTTTFIGPFQQPITATFTTAQAAVGLVVTDGDATVGSAVLTAYSGPNGTGTALGSAASPGGAGNDPYFLGIVDTSGTPRIRSVIVRFQRVSGSDLTIDGVTFKP
jgi:hypothetical protein